MLRVLFNSDFFKNARFAKVKSPVETVVGTTRLVGEFTFPQPGFNALTLNIRYMGQDILNPPTVEGWHTGKEWIDSGTLVERINFTADKVGNVNLPGVRDIIARLRAEGPTLSPERLVDGCLELLGGYKLAPETHNELVALVQSGGEIQHWGGRLPPESGPDAPVDRRDYRILIRLKAEGGHVMASNTKDPVLVVLQLSGGNDALNTVIPYSNPLYFDNRPKVGIPEDQVLPINDSIGFHPAMGPIKKLYDEGKVAIIQGIGYPNPSRSHFRSMDIWHTCEPDEGRRRGLGGPGHSRYRPPEGECADWRQLRSWSAAGSGCAWRTSGLGG